MATEQEIPEWWTIEQVCAYLKIGRASLYKMRKEGLITSYYPHGAPEPGRWHGSLTVRFKKQEILDYMERQKA